MTEMAYCPNCLKHVSFTTKKRRCTTELDGKRYSYVAHLAICSQCGAEATYPPYQEEAGLSFNEEVREQRGLVSLEYVRAVPEMYAIGKRPLSRLLGWGEHTYSQIMEGQTPSEKHSEVIKELHDQPEYYYALLMTGKDKISERTFARSKHATESIIESSYPDACKIYEIGYCFISLAKGDITSRAVQKLTYYTQGFSIPLIGKPIFTQTPCAWSGGPAYGQLWKEFNGRFEKLLDHKADKPYSPPFTSEEDELIRAVYNSFGCYSGETLARMTHAEPPWTKARKRAEAASDAPFEEPIRIEDMAEFFTSVANQRGMKTPGDIRIYAQDAFDRIARGAPVAR